MLAVITIKVSEAGTQIPFTYAPGDCLKRFTGIRNISKGDDIENQGFSNVFNNNLNKKKGKTLAVIIPFWYTVICKKNYQRLKMPEISRFLGIVITMYFNDHSPPHFHAKYGEYKASFCLNTLGIIEGSLPAKIRGKIVEWADLNIDDLFMNWEISRMNGTLNKIEPLV